MKVVFEQAQSAFDKKDFRTARVLFGQCITTHSKDITPEIRNVAIFMVTFLYLQRSDFQQALLYYKLFNEHSNNALLPKHLRSTKLSYLMKRAPFEVITHNTTEVNLSGYSLKGKAFIKIIDSLRDKTNIHSFAFSNNPLNDVEVNYLLNFLLTRKILKEIDLCGLPIGRQAIHNIKEIIKKSEAPSRVNNDSILSIKISNGPSGSDLTLLLRALKQAKSKKVILYLSNYKDQKNAVIVSAAIHQDEIRNQNKKLHEQFAVIGKESSGILDKLMSLNILSKIDTPKIQPTVKLKLNSENQLPTGSIPSPHPVCANALRQAPIRLIESLSAGDSRKENFLARYLSSSKPTFQTQKVIYDEKGTLCAHIINTDSNVFVHILKTTPLNLTTLQAVFPCESLVIYGPDASVVLENELHVSGQTRVICHNIWFKQPSIIHTSQLIVHSKDQISLEGKIDTDHLQLECSVLTLSNTVDIYSHKKLVNKQSTILLRATTIAIHGGKVQTHALKIDSQDILVLPAHFNLEANAVNLSSNNSVVVKNKIQAQSLSIEAIDKAQIGKDALVNVKTCLLIGQEILLRGKINNGDLVELHADNTLVLDSISGISTRKLQINGKKVECLGNLSCDNFICDSDTVKLTGHIKSQLKLVKEQIKEDEAQDPIPIFLVRSRALDVDGRIESNSILHFDVDKIFLSSRSKITPLSDVTNKKPTFTSQIYCKDKLYLEEGAELTTPHHLKVESNDMSLYGTMHAKGSVYLDIIGTGKIHAKGKVSSQQHIHMEGSRCWNSGDVHAEGLLNIAFDRFFINGICGSNPVAEFKKGKLFGKLSGKNVTISTAFFLGLLSNISAENMVQINALVDLYIGLTQGKSVNRSNVIGIDLGFNITVVETIKSIIGFMHEVVATTVSPDKSLKSVIKAHYDATDGKAIAMSGATYALQLAGIAAKLLIVFAPQIGLPSNLILGAVNLLVQLALNGMSIKQEVSKLIESHRSGKPIRARHVYPLILNVKNITMTAANSVSMGVGLPDALARLPHQIQNSHESLLSALPSVAGIFGGSVTNQSVVQINGIGATVTGLCSSTSAVHLFVLHQDIASVNFDNSFISQAECCTVLAAMRNVTTNEFKESYGNQVIETETIVAKNAQLGGHTVTHHLTAMVDNLVQENSFSAKNAVISAHQVTVKGTIEIKGGAIQSEHFEATESAQLDLSHIYLNIKEAEISGRAHLSQVTAEIAALNERKEGKLELVDSTLKANETDLAGHASLQNIYLESTASLNIAGDMQTDDCTLKTSDMHFADASHANLKNTTIEAHAIDQAKNALLETDHVLFKGDDMVMSMQGTVNLIDSAIENDKTHFEGQVSMRDTSVDATTSLNIAGELQSDNCLLKGENIEFSEDSHSQLKNTTVKGTVIHQSSGASLATHHVLFSGKDITLAGQTQVDHEFHMVAENRLTTTASSEIIKGEASEVLLQANIIDKHGKMEVDELYYKGNLSSQDVNRLGTDKDTHAQHVSFETGQDVVIDKTLTCAQDIAITAKSIKDNAAQTVQLLVLESTQGNVEVNQTIKATDKIIVYSENKAIINDSMKGGEVDVYGKNGIECKTPQTINTQPKTVNPSVISGKNPSHPKDTGHSKVVIDGSTVILQSDKDINLKDIDLHYQDLTLKAKGNIIFDLNQQKPATNVEHINNSNQGTHIVGGTAYITAANLINNGQVLKGDTVYIHLDNDLYNKNAGVIAASQFLYIDAKSVYNECKVNTVQGEYSPYQQYESSYILGGNGKDTEGVGLYLHTRGILVNDASKIHSIGSNQIEADCGIRTKARSNTYISYKKDDSSFFGLNNEHEEIRETIIERSEISSEKGQNIISSQYGNLISVATDFKAATGTTISTHRNAEFYDLVGSTEVTKNSRTMGIFYDHEKSYDQYASPTVIADQKGITLVSEADIKMRGTNIITPGHLHVEAKNFDYSVSLLQHDYEHSSFGISASLFNQDFLSCHNPSHFSQPLLNGDSTACQLNELAHSHSGLESILNSWSTGINLANTANAFTNGCRTGTLFQEALKRELPSVYAPQLGINFTDTKTSAHSESLGEGGICVGSADFKVQDTIKLKGAPVQVFGDFVVESKNFIVAGEQLKSDVDQQTQNINFTLSSVGDPYQVDASSSHCHNHGTQQINTQIEVGGQFTIHADTLTLDGAVVDAQKITGEVNTLNIISHLDEVQSDNESYSASTGGNFSISQQKSSSMLMTQASELHTKDAINGSSDEFKVHHLNSEGGKITSDGVNNFKAESIDAASLDEYQHSSGFSINGNVKDFKQDPQINHVLLNDKQSAQITTTDLNFNRKDYTAENQTVIQGGQGTHVQAGHVIGNIVTDSSDGKKITADSSHNYTVAVPNQDAKYQFKKYENYLADQFKQLDPCCEGLDRKEPLQQQSSPALNKHSDNNNAASTQQSNLPGGNNGNLNETPNDLLNQTEKALERTGTRSSQQLEPWEVASIANFDANLDSLEQEVIDYYENSNPISKDEGQNDSKMGVSENYFSFEYQAPKFFEEQGREYFQEQMYGLDDYEKDVACHNGSSINLSFNREDIPKPKSRLENYQESVSKPKDWRNSLPRWERELVDEVDPRIPFDSDQTCSQIPCDQGSYFVDNFVQAPVATPVHVPLYQLPKQQRDHYTYNQLANSDQDPIRLQPKVIDFGKEVGAKIFHDLTDPIKEIWQHPKEVLKQHNNIARILGNPLDPLGGIGELIAEASINIGLEWVNGDAVTRTSMGIELAASALLGAGILRGLSFFERGALETESVRATVPNPEVWGTFRVARQLPRDIRTSLPAPDTNIPHSQIGQVFSKKGYTYTQAREWAFNESGELVPVKDIDFTNHRRSMNHPKPHEHKYVPNSTGGTMKRSQEAEPVTVKSSILFEDNSIDTQFKK